MGDTPPSAPGVGGLDGAAPLRYIGTMRLLLTLLVLLAAACGSSTVQPDVGLTPDDIEAVSLLGTPLRRPQLPADLAAAREAQRRAAEMERDRNPADPDTWIWLGRRTAYLGRYREAVEIFSSGIDRFPEDARFYRHRGHRWITLRRFDRAVEDLSRAAELVEGEPDRIEPDGLPNARNIPTSTLQSNIWYHLGLAHYLRGELEQALAAYRRGMEVWRNPDGLVSMTYWLTMTLRRLGRHEDAARFLEPIHSDLDVIENHSYHRLLLMARGELTPEELLSGDGSALDDATVGFGVAAWLLDTGRQERAQELLRRIVESPEWAAFGFIAAEAELARQQNAASM